MLIKDIANKIYFIGRTYIDALGLHMNFSGSGIRFETKSSKIILKFKGTKYDDPKGCPYVSILLRKQNSLAEYKRYDYSIDEEIKTIVIENYSGIIDVLKRTESPVSQLILLDLEVDELIDYKNPQRLKIEFYGDSLTCGFGTLGEDEAEPFTTRTESFLDSYSYMASKELNADYSVVAVSGFPIYKSRWNQGFPIDSIADMISICDYEEPMTKEEVVVWDNKKFIPDLIVINLGTNDESYLSAGQDWIDELCNELGSFELVQKSSKYVNELNNLHLKIHSFLDDLRSNYQNVKILWLTNFVEVSEVVEKTIINSLKEYAKNYQNIYHHRFHTWEVCNKRGAGHHPSKDMHEIAAKELVKVIKEILEV